MELESSKSIYKIIWLLLMLSSCCSYSTDKPECNELTTNELLEIPIDKVVNVSITFSSDSADCHTFN